MTTSVETLAQLKKADKLTRLNMHKNGPHSYTRGVGRLMRAVEGGQPVSRDAIIEATGWSRNYLKNVVKKAERADMVTLIDAEGERSYAVQLTAEGASVLAKREDAQVKAADSILACLSAEEIEQLNAITDKLIVAARQEGKICAYGKGRKLHKGHKGHVPHGQA